MNIKIIGLIAAFLTTIAFLPQAVKTWQTKSTSDLSPTMFSLLCTGIIMWLAYGILIKDLPIILANAVTLCLALVILFYILKPNHASKIEHIALFTSDLEKMKTFYCANFNAKAGKLYLNPKNNFRSYFITFSSGVRIELMQNENSLTNKSPWGHISISVGSKKNVDQLTEQLRNMGIEIVSKPRLTGDGYYESVIKDPEGNSIELTV
jgi:lactoylglutathione lyase